MLFRLWLRRRLRAKRLAGPAPPPPLRGLDIRPRLPSDVSPAPVSQVADLRTRGAIGRDGDGNAQVALVAPVLKRFAAQWRVNGGSG